VARARTSCAARSHRREPPLVQHLLEGPCPRHSGCDVHSRPGSGRSCTHLRILEWRHAMSTPRQPAPRC
jgi:hypothetical protein